MKCLSSNFPREKNRRKKKISEKERRNELRFAVNGRSANANSKEFKENSFQDLHCSLEEMRNNTLMVKTKIRENA